jgi:hypothetical protein
LRHRGCAPQAPRFAPFRLNGYVAKSVYSAPIKADLIGKPDDTQLNAALSYLGHMIDEASRSH